MALSGVRWILAEQTTVETAVRRRTRYWCCAALDTHKQKFFPLASAGDAQDLLWKLFKAVPFGPVGQMKWLFIHFKAQKCRKTWELRAKTGPHMIFINITESGFKFRKISLIELFLYLNQAWFLWILSLFMWVWMESLQHQPLWVWAKVLSVHGWALLKQTWPKFKTRRGIHAEIYKNK